MASEIMKTSHPNPFLKANCLSNICFWWLKDTVSYGRENDFVTNDMFNTMPNDLSEPLEYDLELAWIDQVNSARKRKKKPSLWKAFMRTCCWDFLKFSMLIIGCDVIGIMQPELMRLIMFYFQPTSTMTLQWAYTYATVFVVLMIMQPLVLCHSLFHLNRIGIRARVACALLIYKKLLRRAPHTNRKMTSLAISLLSVDVAKFEYLFIDMPYLLIVPLQLIIVAFLIWRSIGLTATATGIVLMILTTLPIQVLYSKITLKLRAQQVRRTDDRISLINEAINGIHAVKMFVWENFIKEFVFAARSLEIVNYIKIAYLSAIAHSSRNYSHRFCAFAITLIYALNNRMIAADQILPVTQHLFNLRSNISIQFFNCLKSITDIRVSMRRIEDFLLLDEVNTTIEHDNKNGDNIITMVDVTAFHDEESVVLKNLNLSFADKNFYALVGSVGSGKSSVLKLILGELGIACGKVDVRGKVSYASQEPWLFNASIRDNILFGEEYNEKRYNKVINACALVEDFEQLPYKDNTLVGDRGNNLSGGQCARINLARAVYREADIYLLDDPLSAVDTLVAKKIITECINALLHDKTRILVTHDVQQLDRVSEIVFLQNSKVEFKGKKEKFYQKDQLLTKIIVDDTEVSQEQTIHLPIDKSTKVKKIWSTHNRQEPKQSDDTIAKGAMEISVYLSYFKAGGWTLLFFVIFANCLYVVVTSAFDYGLAVWTDNHLCKNYTTSLVEETRDSHDSYMRNIVPVLGVLIGLIIFMSILKGVVLSRLVFNASKNIHNSAISRLITARLSVFGTNATGKFLNRFTEDTSIMDNALYMAFSICINMIFNAISVILSMIIGNWWIFIFCSISIITTIFIGRMYARVIQNAYRLQARARSPIMSLAASSLEGVATIRSCKAEHYITKEFAKCQDRYTAVQVMVAALCNAFRLWIQLVSAGFLAAIIYLCVFLKNNGINGGFVGLVMLQALSIMECVGFLVTAISEFFAQMTSVERMLELQKLETETLIDDEPGLELPSLWPDKGDILFDHVYLKYSKGSDPVIKDLNFRVKPGSKVGIVGRTGAGKSSLISALFRFVKIDGTIFVDGMDIKKIDLYKLRSKFSVIPQEPFLLRNTLRKNLDPLNKFDDATLYTAFESVELKNFFDSLEFHIERGGSNLSVGQRQLVCLARAILTKNKILILDEATANIDLSTDAVIQQIIRSQFKDCTVLTIAHRLSTVMDNDKILVMDDGTLMEYDHPYLLLQNKESYLSKMIGKCGNVTLQHLLEIAEEAYIEHENMSRWSETTKL